MFAENLDAFIVDFGIPVFYGSQTALALFDQPDEIILNQRVQSRQYRLTFKSSDLVGLKHGDLVYLGMGAGTWSMDSVTAPSFDAIVGYSMDGAAGFPYDVNEVLSIEDGAFFEARIQKQ